jgi:site-specific DNA recombinase
MTPIKSNSPEPEETAGHREFDRLFTKRAVIYLRVSTAKQVHRGDDPDGYSIPAQRDACERKAETLDAEVVATFIDRGESAKTADRPQFQRMLRFVKEQGDIDYVILDKVDRFARNRRDDANMLFELRMAGATLVSVKENIDATPAGELLHAFMAGVAEYYSKNLATEAIKGMTQKAISGGTPGRAAIGYLNTRRRVEGTEIRVVTVDPDRAPLVQWAFEAYATGEWTIRSLTDALADRGLRSLPRGRTLPTPLAMSHVSRMLNNRYYLGKVLFKGMEYDGRHQPLITESLFAQVGEVLAAHDRAGEKQRVHNHYLKGSVFCAHCGSRLCITKAKAEYLYYFCLGRHQRRTDCTAPYLPVLEVEEAVERYYRVVKGLLPQAFDETVRQGLRAELDAQTLRARPEIAYAQGRVNELDTERKRLARGVVTGAIPEDLAREEQARIKNELEGAKRLLATSEVIFGHIEETLTRALALVGRVDDVYRLGSDRVKRLVNQCFFEKLLISVVDDRPQVTVATYQEPWGTLLTSEFMARMERNTKNPGQDFFDRGSKEDLLVAPTGFEPALLP